MKLNCGLSAATRARLKLEKRCKLAKQLVYEGKVVFAWLPVRVADGDCRWLENVKLFASNTVFGNTSLPQLEADIIRAGANRVLTITQWRYEALNGKQEKA